MKSNAEKEIYLRELLPDLIFCSEGSEREGRDEIARVIELFTLKLSLPGDHGEREPPDPISNSEVKPLRADDSVRLHAKVGHCQALYFNPR